MARKLLPYFHIDGQFGGNQSWFLDPWMHLGGCGALTMCDLCIYLALHANLPQCCTVDPDHLTRRSYRKFGMQMKPYLRPRESGIKDLPTFMNGALIWLEDSGLEDFTMEAVNGSEPYAKAVSSLKERIDQDMPVPMLMLKHRDRRFDFFEWHWFLVIGYEDRDTDSVDGSGSGAGFTKPSGSGAGSTNTPGPDNGPAASAPVDHDPTGERETWIRVATYGKEHWLPFRAFWDTGQPERGGLVLVRREG